FVHATITELHYYDLANSTATKVDLGWDRGLANPSIQVSDDGFIALLADGARHKPARYRRAGGQWQREWIDGDNADHLFEVKLAKDGQTILYNASTASKPEQWHRGRLNGTHIEVPMQVTELNGHLKPKTLARTEVVRWKGALDEEVEGILYYPHGYQPGK